MGLRFRHSSQRGRFRSLLDQGVDGQLDFRLPGVIRDRKAPSSVWTATMTLPVISEGSPLIGTVRSTTYDVTKNKKAKIGALDTRPDLYDL